MKWLIYILLLVNLSFFVWHYRFPNQSHNQQDRVVRQEAEQPPRLVLVKEYHAQQKTRPTVQDQDTTSDSAGGPDAKAAKTDRCYSLGPFADKPQTDQAQKFLKGLGFKSQRRSSKDSKRKGFWVLIPPHKNRKGAQGTIRKLKQLGVKDYFLVANGDQKLAVSLGMFSKPDLARRRWNEIQKLGFKPRVENIKLPQRRYWLDWPLKTNRQLSNEEIAHLYKTFEGIGQVERVCKNLSIFLRPS